MIDYTALITSQHADKPKFAAMVQAVAGSIGDISTFIQSLSPAFDLDTAIGVQLDIVGQWIGQSRSVGGVLTLGYFGFSDNVVAENFGEEGNASIGGRFYEEGEPFTSTAVLADPEYRTVLKAKILRNHYKGTTKEITDALNFIFNAPAHIVDEGIQSIVVVINAPISPIGQSLLTNLDLLPRPAGVAIGQIVYTDLSAHGFAQASGSGQL
jgi:hypothetical protein